MPTKRTLTKSRFKLGIECPTKLFYTNKKKEYADQMLDDPFLQELANGGFQVGELAKFYFPGGVDIPEKDYEASLAITNELLEKEDVTIFEAAVAFENLFIRIDVFRKKGNRIEVIEVKSKSFDSSAEDQFLNRNGTIAAGWLSYVYDVAFQKYVVQKAFPEAEVSAFLMMADKSAVCPSDALNQKFRVYRNENGYSSVRIAGEINANDLEPKILGTVDVDELCDKIFENTHSADPDELGFEGRIAFLAENYERDEKIPASLGGKCKDCQFRASKDEKAAGMKSGFEECWKENLQWNDDDFEKPSMFDIWDFRRKDQLLDQKRARMSEVSEDDLGMKSDDKPGISRTERQLLQIQKAVSGDTTPFVDKVNLRRELSGWKFPLHFIDFETSQAAIPFLKGHRPYEPIAFQFSHHTVDKDGTIKHAGEFLHAEPGVFPNFEFIRALKPELENDEGTIFRYAAHENTYLCHIWKQLFVSNEPDKSELMAFIQQITKSTSSISEKWEGPRNMVDMLELVKRYYYDPHTNGSNSIKFVLPAVMNSSPYLRQKYSEPIYGSSIPSRNFESKTWIETEEGKITDPYKLLPKMMLDISDHDFEIFSNEDELGNGGAALAAYAKLQYEDMSDYERGEIKAALLRYCELDTFAMVMIYEAFREMSSER